MSIWLEHDVSLEKVRQKIIYCYESKAPSPNGFTFTFNKKAWHLIKNEILNMVNKIFRLGKLLKGVNISYLA
jgi:hypothetical protein